MTPDLAIVVAMTEAGLIGKDGGLPWPRIPRDMRRFRMITEGGTVILGRKTWDSLHGQPLPGRKNIVLSRDRTFHPPRAWVATCIDGAIGLIFDSRPFVIGGAEIFAAFLPLCRRIHLTLIDGEFAGDTYFPGGVPGPPEWRAVDEERHEADGRNPVGVTFLTMERDARP